MSNRYTIGFRQPDGSYYVPRDSDGFPSYVMSHAEAAAMLWCGYEDEASRGVACVIEADPFMPDAGVKLPKVISRPLRPLGRSHTRDRRAS